MSNPLPKVDVLVVGTGAAGGIASYVLANAGIKVVALEAGPYYTLTDIMKNYDDSKSAWDGASKYAKEIPTWRPDAKSPTAAPPVSLDQMANMVGGTTNHYGTQSWRFREDDFKARTATIEKYGEDSIPTGSTYADWPITYDELEPYYDNVEYLIGVSGQAGNIQGKTVEGGNPFESPRQRDYPMPPVQRSDYTELAKSAMTDLGYHPFPQPTAVNSIDYDDRPACTYCSYCSQGCWNDSKGSTRVTAIRKAEATGNLEVRPNSRVTKILSNDKGEVTGVLYIDADGNEQEQPAGVVIIGTYVYENNRLLLLSTSGYYPNGLSNNGGNVGKHYMAHAYVMRWVYFENQKLNLWAGYSGQATTIDDLNGDHFDHTGLGFVRGGALFAQTGATPLQRANILPPSAPFWGAAYKKWVHDNADKVSLILCQAEPLSYETNFLDLDPTTKDPLGFPVIRVTYSMGENEKKATTYLEGKIDEIAKAMGATELWPMVPAATPVPISSHCYGGTRMGDDPATSVVDKYGISHEAPNLMILGGSNFPTSSGYNPTQTIEAHAWFAAEYLAKNLSKIAV